MRLHADIVPRLAQEGQSQSFPEEEKFQGRYGVSLHLPGELVCQVNQQEVGEKQEKLHRAAQQAAQPLCQQQKAEDEGGDPRSVRQTCREGMDAGLLLYG